ncbi:MAG: hypothetical protein ABUT20_21760 [Bacteroidota bacterium]
MKNGSKLIVFFYAVVIIAAGCSKGGAPVEDIHAYDFSDSTVPVLELTNPLENQVFSNGDIIKVDGKVTDNGLYKGSIKITNDAGGATIKEQQFEIHGFQLYNFHFEYKTAVIAAANYTISVQFEDHGSNEALKLVKVKVNP